MSRFLGKVLFGRATWFRSAVLLVAILGLFHLQGSALRGVVYGISWFAAVIVSPILVLATGIDAILFRLRGQIRVRRRRGRVGRSDFTLCRRSSF